MVAKVRASGAALHSLVLDQLSELLLWLGGVTISMGVALIYVPAGVITFGLAMIIAGALIARATGGS